MLGEKFDTLCKTTAAISMILFLVAPAFVFRFFDEPFMDAPIYFFIVVFVYIVSFCISALQPYCKKLVGIDEKNELSDDVTLVFKRAANAYESEDVTVAVLSTESKRKIKNTLEGIESIENKQEGFIARLIKPLTFAAITAAMYMAHDIGASKNIFLVAAVFVSSFSIFYLWVQMYLDMKIGRKYNAIANTVMRNQYVTHIKTPSRALRPYTFNLGYGNAEGYPMSADKVEYKWYFYTFLDDLRESEKKAEVDEILKEFVMTENSSMSTTEKEEVKLQLMKKLDELDKEASAAKQVVAHTETIENKV